MLHHSARKNEKHDDLHVFQVAVDVVNVHEVDPDQWIVEVEECQEDAPDPNGHVLCDVTPKVAAEECTTPTRSHQYSQQCLNNRFNNSFNNSFKTFIRTMCRCIVRVFKCRDNTQCCSHEELRR